MLMWAYLQCRMFTLLLCVPYICVCVLVPHSNFYCGIIFIVMFCGGVCFITITVFTTNHMISNVNLVVCMFALPLLVSHCGGHVPAGGSLFVWGVTGQVLYVTTFSTVIYFRTLIGGSNFQFLVCKDTVQSVLSSVYSSHVNYTHGCVVVLVLSICLFWLLFRYGVETSNCN